MLQVGRPLSGTLSCSAPVTNLPWARVLKKRSRARSAAGRLFRQWRRSGKYAAGDWAATAGRWALDRRSPRESRRDGDEDEGEGVMRHGDLLETGAIRALLREEAAVDREDVPGHHGRRAGGEEKDRAHDLLGLGEAAHRRH